MEIKRATIERNQDDAFLVLELDTPIKIILTDDNPNNVKEAFNRLLINLKKSEFTFELHDESQDLYFHICTEYIRQLNSELKSVYNELKDYGLLESTPEITE